MLNEYGKGGEVLGLVVGYSGEASWDLSRVANLVVTRLASKNLEYVRTSASIAKACKLSPGRSYGFLWAVRQAP
jgi:hypothetical protein